ncbi:hypothetical protein R3W88_014419 [Solanum pinnatisectum]|uniref:Uncharacterized protein n=1 Tax=Solanum pinnatisectum TaxID=50273 RepID=A0AAV9KRK2_9SOLN|nr:hypothetical protein R3W88_014419 [Solanum pinnatisectum]
MLVESSKKCRRTGKSLVCSPKTPIVLHTDEEDAESVHSSTPPPSQTLTKNEIKFLAIGKEAYFKSKTVLRGKTIRSEIREISTTKEENYVLTSKFTQGRVIILPMKVLKGEMSSFHKLVFEVVHKGILPRGERSHEASFRDMGIGNALENIDPIDWPSLMIKHMARVVDPKKPHQLAYGNLLTTVFREFRVPLKEGRLLNRNDMLTRSTLAECNLLDAAEQVHAVPLHVAGLVASLLNELNVAKAQNEELRADSQGEVSRLKDQLIKQQLDNNALMDHMLQVLTSSSTHPNPSSSAL